MKLLKWNQKIQKSLCDAKKGVFEYKIILKAYLLISKVCIS
jgi:hypothetical protein